MLLSCQHAARGIATSPRCQQQHIYCALTRWQRRGRREAGAKGSAARRVVLKSGASSPSTSVRCHRRATPPPPLTIIRGGARDKAVWYGVERERGNKRGRWRDAMVRVTSGAMYAHNTPSKKTRARRRRHAAAARQPRPWRGSAAARDGTFTRTPPAHAIIEDDIPTSPLSPAAILRRLYAMYATGRMHVRHAAYNAACGATRRHTVAAGQVERQRYKARRRHCEDTLTNQNVVRLRQAGSGNASAKKREIQDNSALLHTKMLRALTVALLREI